MIRLTEDQARGLLQLVRDAGIESQAGENAYSALTGMQEQLDSPNHSADLIEKMASLLKQASSRSILSAETIKALRMAILTPRELANLDAIKANHCVRCGRQLLPGEVCSMHGVGEVYCYFCLPPQTMSCQHCHERLMLSTGVGRIIQKMVKECTYCKAAALGAAPKEKVAEEEKVAGETGVAAPDWIQQVYLDGIRRNITPRNVIIDVAAATHRFEEPTAQFNVRNVRAPRLENQIRFYEEAAPVPVEEE